jgi:hypothetical protein
MNPDGRITIATSQAKIQRGFARSVVAASPSRGWWKTDCRDPQLGRVMRSNVRESLTRWAHRSATNSGIPVTHGARMLGSGACGHGVRSVCYQEGCGSGKKISLTYGPHLSVAGNQSARTGANGWWAACWGNRPTVRSLAFSLPYFQLLFLLNVFILI